MPFLLGKSSFNLWQICAASSAVAEMVDPVCVLPTDDVVLRYLEHIRPDSWDCQAGISLEWRHSVPVHPLGGPGLPAVLPPLGLPPVLEPQVLRGAGQSLHAGRTDYQVIFSSSNLGLASLNSTWQKSGLVVQEKAESSESRLQRSFGAFLVLFRTFGLED